MKKYIIQGREAGNMFAECDTYEQAIETIAEFEAIDEFNGTYTENYYQIVEVGRKKRSAIELTRKYAEIQYFPIYGWFQIDEEPDGICLPAGIKRIIQQYEDEIKSYLDRFYQIAKNL